MAKRLFQRPPPDHLPGIYCLRLSRIGYRPTALATISRTPSSCLLRTTADTGATIPRISSASIRKRTELTPGTVLVREWIDIASGRMVMADGFAWNGQTYDSLSKVAFAITGTRWNGPRFFGL